MARLSTDPPASELYRACDFIIQYLLHDWVRSQNVEYGVAPTRQQLVRQALLFVPDGLPEAVENRLCLPFHGGPPSQRTYLRRFRKSLERAHRHLTCHSLFANPCVAGEGVELVGLGRFGTQF